MPKFPGSCNIAALSLRLPGSLPSGSNSNDHSLGGGLSGWRIVDKSISAIRHNIHDHRIALLSVEVEGKGMPALLVRLDDAGSISAIEVILLC